MNLRILRTIDQYFGPPMLLVLAPMVALASALFQPSKKAVLKQHIAFIKLKGGGSLLIAMPALLAVRRKYPESQLILICTEETKTYAELLGIFDTYTVIDDSSLVSLARTSFAALRSYRFADIYVDLEPNSTLAAVFGMLTLARRRIGLVKPEEHFHAAAYTDTISFDVHAPIYIYYDQIATMLQAATTSTSDCAAQLQNNIVTEGRDLGADTRTTTIGLAPFTSDFAPERMMPKEVWSKLLMQTFGAKQMRFFVFGSEKNVPMGAAFVAQLRMVLPNAEVVDLCGKGSLAKAAADIKSLDEFWAVDSGLLHLARLLGVTCRSFWGPTQPSQRLRTIAGLNEETHYRPFACSPCTHSNWAPPCGGDNLCMKTMADPSPNLVPAWMAKGKS